MDDAGLIAAELAANAIRHTPSGHAGGSGTMFLMPTQQLLDRVRELRDAGRTPKEIARALKMPPGAVAPIIRSLAAAGGRDPGGRADRVLDQSGLVIQRPGRRCV